MRSHILGLGRSGQALPSGLYGDHRDRGDLLRDRFGDRLFQDRYAVTGSREQRCLDQAQGLSTWNRVRVARHVSQKCKKVIQCELVSQSSYILREVIT